MTDTMRSALRILTASFVGSVLLVCCVGCGPSAERQQAAANAIPGVDAITDVGEEVIAEGVKANIEGAVGLLRSELPPPTKTPEQIRQNPNSYQEEANEGRGSILKSGTFWSIIGGSLLTVVGVLRFVPGAHGPIVGILHSVLESKSDKAARKKRDQMAEAGAVMIQVLETFTSAEAEAVKDKIAAKLPAGASDAVKDYIASVRGDK